MKSFCAQGIPLMLATVLTVCKSVKRDLLRSQDAVTSLIGSEDFYIQIKRLIPRTYVDDKESGRLRDADYTGKIPYEYTPLPVDDQTPKGEEEVEQDLADKIEICARIFNRFLFEFKHELAANFELKEEETMQELYQNYPDIYDGIYGKWPEVKDEWLNPYTPYVVAVGEEKFRERVFRCVTRHKKTSDDETHTSYVGYFVSPIYQLWTAEDLFVDGRFLFTSNEQKDELKVFAVAEESAVINSGIIKDTQLAYYEYNQAKTRPRKDPVAESDILCRLPLRDKIRICTIALNAPQFPVNIRFLPEEAFVEPDCELKKVSARLSINKRKWYSVMEPKYVTQEIEFNYNEWTIGCRAAQVMDNNELSWSTYRMSRGMKEHTAIIYKAPAENTSEYVPYIGLNYVLMVKGSGTLKRIYDSRIVKQ